MLYGDVEMSDIIAYKLLGKYECSADLINFKGRLCHPEISINIEVYGDNTYCNVYIDSEKGFVVLTKSTFKLVDATITSNNGDCFNISIDEAKLFILSNYNLFEPYKHIAAHKMYYPEYFKKNDFVFLPITDSK